MVKRNFLTFFVAILTVVSLSGMAVAQDKAPTKAPTVPPVVVKKKLPARDKTGKFVKGGGKTMAPATTVTKPKTKKALPPRDAKGRFMKKTPAAPPTAPAKP